MRFSVIVPAYNCERFIEKCMNSIIGQTYRDIELIIINDGSTDATEATVKRVMEQNPDFAIKYMKIPNSGPSSARNRGIEMASGDYICFLDSDDMYDSNLFLELSQLEDDYDICLFGWQEVEEESGAVFAQYTDAFSFLEQPVSGVEAAKMKFHKKIWLCNCNEVYKNSVIQEHGLRYPEGIYAAEDTFFIYSCLLNARKVCSLNRNYFYNTYRKNSLMHASFSDKNLTELKALKMLVDYSQEKFGNDDLYQMFYSLYYYSPIALTKRLVRTAGWNEYRKFKKQYRERIPVLERRENLLLTKREMIEDVVLRFSPMLFFVMCKIVYSLKLR